MRLELTGQFAQKSLVVAFNVFGSDHSPLITDARLGDAGARALANVFTPDKKGDNSMQLMYLHLNNNRIGDLGATHIAEVTHG